jgi:hypothetical protein
MKLLLLSPLLLLKVAANAATIKICVQSKGKGQVSPLSNAIVYCYDEDLDGDDFMAMGTTSSDGCVKLSYDEKESSYWNPNAGWDAFFSNPDIYCLVTKSNFYKLYTDTKEDWSQGRTANFGTVTIFPNRVERGDPGTVNGCGAENFPGGINEVIDFVTGFKNQCNNHDLCYNDCDESQENCDLEFKAMMYSECNEIWDTSKKSHCKTAADGMYYMVNEHGSDAYKAGQEAYECA